MHVVHDPADGTVLQTIQRGVVARPLHHALRRVEVAHLRAALRRRERAAAGIGEEVQHLRTRCMRANPVPLCALLGEDSEVAEVGAGELEADAGRLNRPLCGQRAPSVPAVALLTVERGGGPRPGGGVLRTPQRLRARAHERKAPEALELASAAGINQFIVVVHRVRGRGCSWRRGRPARSRTPGRSRPSRCARGRRSGTPAGARSWRA